MGSVGQDYVLLRTEKYKTNYLEAPLKFTIDFGKDNGFILTPGAYLAIGISGKQEVNYPDGATNVNKIRFSGDTDNNAVLTLKPIEAGALLGLGYIRKDFLIEGVWEQSLSSVHHEGDEFIYRTLRLGFNYFF